MGWGLGGTVGAGWGAARGLVGWAVPLFYLSSFSFFLFAFSPFIDSYFCHFQICLKRRLNVRLNAKIFPPSFQRFIVLITSYAAMAQVGLNIAPAAVGNNKVSADSCEVIDLDI